MALKIRLTRLGSRHRPFFRLAVVDSRARRDGRPVSILGYYNPIAEPFDLKVENEEALDWLQKGAQPTDTARSLLKQTGVWQRYQLLKQGKSAETVDAEVAKIIEGRESKVKAVVEGKASDKETKAAEKLVARKAAAEAKAVARAEAEARAAAGPVETPEPVAEEAPAEEAPAETAS